MHIRTRMARGERGLVVPPAKATAPVVKPKRRRSDETRWLQGATRLGITYEAYVAHVQAGEKWCSHDRRWEPRSEFGGDASNPEGLAHTCRETARVKAREWQRQHRPPKRQEVGT